MNHQEFFDEINAAVDTGPEGVNGATRFREQPWWDSMAALTLLAIADSIYGRQLSAAELRECSTLEDVCKRLED